MSTRVMFFNPFTGKPRLLDDIASDPRGILVWDGEEPLKAPPPQRKPLTDDEVIAAIKNISFNEMTAFNIARAIERAHGIGGQDE